MHLAILKQSKLVSECQEHKTHKYCKQSKDLYNYQIKYNTSYVSISVGSLQQQNGGWGLFGDLIMAVGDEADRCSLQGQLYIV